MSGVNDILSIAASGMSAQRVRLTATASNLANARTTKTEEGGPYQRRSVVFEAKQLDPFGDQLEQQMSTVEVPEIEKSDEYVEHYMPDHPHADPATGMVKFPKVDLMTEMVDMMNTQRSYEANANVVDIAKELAQKALEIGR
ncbi:MAG: flagellar basal body rod protein FlgC [Proteobacteria bacterium]|nr:flagellar basal body rod protein FlgC [Pseudomonadota bacterium]MCP4921707.1 flagellar basal body rod protein FlgC [Pseudomonadota bacterium]